LRAGFVARFDSIKMICFGFLENSQHPPWCLNMSSFWPDFEIGHPGKRELFYPQPSLTNVFNRRDARSEVTGNCPSAGKTILLLKCLNLRPKAQGGRPGRRRSLQDKLPFLNFWSQILIDKASRHHLQVWRPLFVGPSEPQLLIQKYFTMNLFSSFSLSP
jgi:hypothetical protein